MVQYDNLAVNDIVEFVRKINGCCDPYQRIGYKVQAILYVYGCDSCEQLDRRVGTAEDNFRIKEENIYNRRINGLDLSLEQWHDDDKYNNFVRIRIADTQDIVCDRVQHIWADGDWEDRINELFINSIRTIRVLKSHDLNLRDGKEFNTDNDLVNKIETIFDSTDKCEAASVLCENYDGEAIVLGSLIITKDIKTVATEPTNYKIFDMDSNCEEVFNVEISNYRVFRFNVEKLSAGTVPVTDIYVHSFKYGAWQKYILDYYDNMQKELEGQKVKEKESK